MTGLVQKRAVTGLMTGMAIMLSACSEHEVVEAPPEGVVPGLEVTDARLVLPPVAGNPAAVYFEIANEGVSGVSIDGVEVEGAASATVHDMMEFDFRMTMADAGPIAVRTGESKTFEPGSLHVMAFELAEGIEAGGTIEVTLKILGGKTHKFDAEIRAAGDER